MVKIINPNNGLELTRNKDHLIDSRGNKFSIVNNVPRISELDNYTDNFGFQWNKFEATQIDRKSDEFNISRNRFFSETHWDQEDLLDKNILEVGSGAGRFSKVVLEHTNATLYSIDYSDAVTANYRNNGSAAAERFHLFQASIYMMPFENNSFDKVFCLGVLQHTPNFEDSIKVLINKAKPGTEIVVDFYPIKGWWTKINAKYILRPITRRLSHEYLLRIIENNIDWLIKLHFIFHKIGLGVLTRFLPLCDIHGTFQKNLSGSKLREMAILDTFDQYSPEYDNPQRISNVVEMFRKNGATVTFSGFEKYSDGDLFAAVVRAIKD